MADRLGVSKSTVKRAIEDGELRETRLAGKHPKIDKQSADDWIAGKRAR